MNGALYSLQSGKLLTYTVIFAVRKGVNNVKYLEERKLAVCGIDTRKYKWEFE